MDDDKNGEFDQVQFCKFLIVKYRIKIAFPDRTFAKLVERRRETERKYEREKKGCYIKKDRMKRR